MLLSKISLRILYIFLFCDNILLIAINLFIYNTDGDANRIKWAVFNVIVAGYVVFNYYTDEDLNRNLE